jgi:hypothetical protein
MSAADYEDKARAELAGDPKQAGLSEHARTCPEPWCAEYIKVYDALASNVESVIPESVTAMMGDDPMVPTAPLEDFLIAMVIDDNTWWRIGCGHHLNLFDAACERAGLM